MSFENFEVGEIIRGRFVGTFRIESFDRIAGQNMVWLKEVHKLDHTRESPCPKLAFTENMIRKLDSADAQAAAYELDHFAYHNA